MNNFIEFNSECDLNLSLSTPTCIAIAEIPKWILMYQIYNIIFLCDSILYKYQLKNVELK
jgi:hypothetical protein